MLQPIWNMAGRFLRAPGSRAESRAAQRRSRPRPGFEQLEHRMAPAVYNLNLSSYLGGNALDQARDIAYDSAGNFYITGGTISANFPVTPGAYQTVHNPGTPESDQVQHMDVFVAKFSATGSLIWSTFLGGPNYDRAYGIEVDSAGNVYVAGRAGRNFPVTSGAFQTQFQGGLGASFYGHQDGFVAKLSADGGSLLWSSYFGTNDPYAIRDLALDASNNVYIASAYQSGSYTPAVAAAFSGRFQSTPRGGHDGVVAKIAANGSSVLWASYLGGSGNEDGQPSIRVDGSGNAYFLTTTASSNMPATTNAYDRTYNGGNDLFLAKFNANGTALTYGTYFGGSGMEGIETHSLWVDGSGRAHIAGTTRSSNLPTTTGAYQRTLRGTSDSFVAKFSADGRTLLASTYFGGGGNDYQEGIGLNALGRVFITGNTNSADLPTTSDGYQRTYRGAVDAYLVVFASDLRTLAYSTYLGGSGADSGRSLIVDGAGAAYVVGSSSSNNWPTASPYQGTHRGGGDAVFARFIVGSGPSTGSSPTPTTSTGSTTAAPSPPSATNAPVVDGDVYYGQLSLEETSLIAFVREGKRKKDARDLLAHEW